MLIFVKYKILYNNIYTFTADMMKVLQIAFLWVAGLGLLGHSIIPHHHHSSKEQHCNYDNTAESHDSTHEHQHFGEHDADHSCDEYANHEHEEKNACELQVNTYTKHTLIQLVATLTSSTSYSIQEQKQHAYNAFRIDFTQRLFLGNYFGRAPPTLS